jgi:purine-binding chemotaxis protein CheW
MVAITPMPEAPPWFLGLINLRGRVIPVLDLRARLALPPLAPSLDTPIIVAEHGGRTLGLVADAALEVLSIPATAIEQADVPGSQTRPISAIARNDDRLILLLDLERLCQPLDGVPDDSQADEAQPP